MSKQKIYSERVMRHRRLRARICGSASRPRLSVFRSNKHLFLQLIDDAAQKTILGVSDATLRGSKKMLKSERAFETGKLLAQRAREHKITQVVFDRGGYRYHGRVQKVADGAREGGLKF